MLDGEEMPVAGLNESRMSESQLEIKGRESRGQTPVAPPPVPQKDPTPAVPAPPVKKSGLGRQFGRLGGAVSGKSRRNQ